MLAGVTKAANKTTNVLNAATGNQHNQQHHNNQQQQQGGYNNQNQYGNQQGGYAQHNNQPGYNNTPVGMAHGMAAQVAPGLVPPPPSNPMWSSRMTQFSGEPVKTEDWIWACCCTQCAQAMAKSKVDRSHPCYNFFYWQPIGSYSYVRVAYGIEGTCGDDMGWGMFCPWCTTRQMMTEGNVRGGLTNPTFGANANQWQHSLFDCTPCDLCEVFFCLPCVTHEIRQGLPGQLAAHSCCFDWLCIYPQALYGQVRNDHGILSDFGPAEDICLPIFCFPCTMVRARKENNWHKAQTLQGQAQGAIQQHGVNKLSQGLL